jgi:FAD/FMN-containing dehydrogenase
MAPRIDIDLLRQRLDGVRLEGNPSVVRQKSRDFFWYSPRLKRLLDHVSADAVVCPISEEEVVHALAVAYEMGIPVTPRGAGTGNYGQAMPLAGGIVLDLSGFASVGAVSAGRVVADPGVTMALLDDVTRSASGQELRIHPSSSRTATLGGFVAGGSTGVGSVRWGGLRDWGNILRLRVATMEKSPRLLDLTGADLHKVSHAYGTNGIITQVEMPLAPAYGWVDAIVGFDSLPEALTFADALARLDGLLLKNLSVVDAPVPCDCFTQHRRFLPREKAVVITTVAEFAVGAFVAFLDRWRGAEVLFRSDLVTEEEAADLPPAFELTWNHTTLRALRVDPSITYLQALYPEADTLRTIADLHARLGDEVPAHVEFMRLDGRVACFGIPLVRFTTEERLDDIMHLHEQAGAVIFDPHRFTLEEGGMKRTDTVQLAFKNEADPRGLLNPGKMAAWEDPNFDWSSGHPYLYPGLAEPGLHDA